MAGSGLAVLCTSSADSIDRLVASAQKLQSQGLRTAALCSPTLQQALVAAKVPHVTISSPQDVQQLMSDRVEAVVAAPPCLESDAPVKRRQRELHDWMNGAFPFVRTAAWNYAQIAVALNDDDTSKLVDRVSNEGRLSLSVQERRQLSEKAFDYFSKLDATIAATLRSENQSLHDVLVVGNGGREHAIVWKLAQSASVRQIYVAPGNAGTFSDKDPRIADTIISNVDIKDYDTLVEFAVSKEVSLCVVGPEAPLIDGLADKMIAAGIKTFGPSEQAAVLEASKAFSKDFMHRNEIPTAAYANFTEYEKAKAYVESVDHEIVVKASGIAAGKGVLLPETKEETLQALKDVMLDKAFGSAGDEVVLEERMTGEEVSLLAFSDGTNVVTMPGVQDHKRAMDADRGENTGGMGAYTPAPCLTPSLEKECIRIVEHVIAAMKEEGRPYVGVLYPGFMLTPQGPKVLEFNCRFGDPETQVLLPMLSSDLFEVMMSCVQGKLDASIVHWKKGAAVTVVMASQGYPDSYPKGRTISGLDQANDVENVHVFHAGTTSYDSNIVTSGGRVLAVTALDSTLEAAVKRAYVGVKEIHFDGMQYRSDIALKGLLRSAKKLKIGVLGSTRGSSLQPVLDAINAKELDASIEVVISNKESAGILARAREHDLENHAISSKGLSRADFDAKVSDVLRSKNVDLVLLVGYMRILSSDFCSQWAGQVLNVHPSLLPEFAGGMDLDVHKQVLEAKKTESGCTIHFVTEEVDSGPIAVQFKCPVVQEDTPESLKERVQALEGQAFIHAIRLFQSNLLTDVGQTKGITYADAGVSIDAGNELVNRIKPYCKATIRTGCDADLGGFGGVFDLQAAGYDKDTALVACTDGVGTKLLVAQLSGKHDTVGIDLVAMCVNDLVVQGAEPLFFLDYYACGKLSVEEAADVVKGIANGCEQSRCGLIGGETAEMPSMYNDGDYDLAGFCVGAVRKQNILPTKVMVGYTVLGLASSGVHSNGYSLVRKLVDMAGLQYKDACPFEQGKTLGESLLTPTKIYVKQLMPAIHEGLISALAHITGGGLLENIPRVLTDDLAVELDCNSWTMPPVFQWMKSVGKLDDTEIARTFNCGIGMVLMLPTENVDAAIASIENSGEKVFRMGHVVERGPDGEQVILQGRLQ